jgi:hypothetical protein
MWSLKAKKEPRLCPYRDALACMIMDWINILQRNIISLLQRWDRKTTVIQKKIAVMVFCIACGGYCTYLLGHALFAKAGAVAIRYEPIPPVAQPPPFYRDKDSVRTGNPARPHKNPN